MNHKYKNRKSSRAGCLFCKPYKHPAFKNKGSYKTAKQRRADDNAKDQLKSSDKE